MAGNAERLEELAIERAKQMERIQQIDDEAAELIQPVRKALGYAVADAVEAEEQFVAAWGHVIERQYPE